MGCWNATCNVSHMPIFGGDKVVLIPLIQTQSTVNIDCCEATDNFAPIGFPIIGEYNEYGGITNAKTHPCNVTQLMTKKYYIKQDDKYKEYVPENLEALVNNVFCCSYAFAETNNPYLFPDRKAPVSFMMIHKGLYDDMVHEMGRRIPYGQTNDYQSCLTTRFEKILKEKKEILSLSCELSEHKECPRIDALKDLVTSETYREIEQILCPCSSNASQWKSIAHAIIDNPEIINLAVEQTLFTHALSAGRMGYLCVSGMGSQSIETAMQALIAKFIIKHAKGGKGYQETVFFHQ